MIQPIPDINTLLFHLRNCPDEFLQSPHTIPGGTVNTQAVIKDVYRLIAGDVTIGDWNLPAPLHNIKFDNNQVIAMHIGAWFFSHSCFLNRYEILQGVATFLHLDLPEVSLFVPYAEWINEEDRAEEFIRIALKSCDLMPQGETADEAADKLHALSTIKRRSVLQGSNEALQRIKAIRKKMAEAKAREAANVYGRE